MAADNATDHLVTDNFAKTSSSTRSPLMFTVILKKKIPQPLVAADNTSDHLVTDNFAITSSGTLSPLMFTVVLEKKIRQPLVAADNAPTAFAALDFGSIYMV